MSISQDFPNPLGHPIVHTPPKQVLDQSLATIIQNTEDILPSYKGDINSVLTQPLKIGQHEDDLALHQDRINAIDNNLLRACDAIQKVFCDALDKAKTIAKDKGFSKEWPDLKKIMEKL